MVRSFADGLVSVLLPAYLTALGFSAVAGRRASSRPRCSARRLLTLAVGLRRPSLRAARRCSSRACALMFATGLGFATRTRFWPLLLVALRRHAQPDRGRRQRVPADRAVAARRSRSRARARALYARAQRRRPPRRARSARSRAPSRSRSRRALGVRAARRDARRVLRVRRRGRRRGAALPRVSRRATAAPRSRRRAPLARSRGIVLRLAALFTLDSFGGGFVVAVAARAVAVPALRLLARGRGDVLLRRGAARRAFSQLLSPLLARAHRADPTMVVHAPARERVPRRAPRSCRPRRSRSRSSSLRMTLSQMDVPARQAFVMAVVPPEERAAAAIGHQRAAQPRRTALSPLARAAWLLARRASAGRS